MNEIKLLFSNFHIHSVLLKHTLFVGIDRNRLKIALMSVFDGPSAILPMCDVVFDKSADTTLHSFIDKRVPTT